MRAFARKVPRSAAFCTSAKPLIGAADDPTLSHSWLLPSGEIFEHSQNGPLIDPRRRGLT